MNNIDRRKGIWKKVYAMYKKTAAIAGGKLIMADGAVCLWYVPSSFSFYQQLESRTSNNQDWISALEGKQCNKSSP